MRAPLTPGTPPTWNEAKYMVLIPNTISFLQDEGMLLIRTFRYSLHTERDRSGTLGQ